jgi:high-affinity K+ transport system ATPase subunit B
MSHDATVGILGDPAAVLRAVGEAFIKLDPRRMILSPVMFTIEVGAVLTSALAVARLAGQLAVRITITVATSVRQRIGCGDGNG